MFVIIVKNISATLLSLGIISLLIFFLSKAVPGDPIMEQLNIDSDAVFAVNLQKEYSRKAKELKLDRPSFYFSVLPSNFPKNLNDFLPLEQKKWLKNFLFQGYQMESLSILIRDLNLDETKAQKEDPVLIEKLRQKIYASQDIESLSKEIDEISKVNPNSLVVEKIIGDLLVVQASERSNLIPKLFWHGKDNQYHHWIAQLLSGNPGNSYQDNRPVSFKIKRALVWTVFLVFTALIFSYMIGVSIGVFLSYLKNEKIVRLIERLLFGIYAIPVFWLSTLMLVFFTTAEYGSLTNIFPSVGLTPIDLGEPWYVRLSNYGQQLILPCFILIIHSLAFIASLTKRNVDKNKKQQFVMSAKAFGFSEKQILVREVFPHTLLPIITSVSSAIPAAIGGALVVEIIFNIPGMGRLLFDGILRYDWPVVFSIVMLIALITILSFMLAEILYKWADPRIQQKQDQN